MVASSNKAGDQATASDRITVALIAKVAADLHVIQEATGLSKTDAVNRAISVYRFIDEELRNGSELVLRRPDTGQEQLVRFL